MRDGDAGPWPIVVLMAAAVDAGCGVTDENPAWSFHCEFSPIKALCDGSLPLKAIMYYYCTLVIFCKHIKHIKQVEAELGLN